MRLQQIQNLTAATGSSSGAYKMADLTKKYVYLLLIKIIKLFEAQTYVNIYFIFLCMFVCNLLHLWLLFAITFFFS